MISVVDKEFLKTAEGVVSAKREEVGRISRAYREVIGYNRWVIPVEGIHAGPGVFDVSLLNKVYIGNVCCPRDALQSLVGVFGPACVTVVGGKECAFVDFDNPHGAYLCISETNGMVYEGRRLKAGRTSTFPSSIPRELKDADRCMVYISNIDERVEEEQLRDIFENVGSVAEVRLVCDVSFRHKGYGYVRFGRPQDARKALGYSNKIGVYGRRLRIGPTVIKMVLPERGDSSLPEEVFRIKARIENMIFGRGRMVILRNLIDVDDADEDFDREIESEVRKYGGVEKFGISKGEEVVVYCMYSSNDEARHSFNILNGRFFGGRRIQAEISRGDFPL